MYYISFGFVPARFSLIVFRLILASILSLLLISCSNGGSGADGDSETDGDSGSEVDGGGNDIETELSLPDDLQVKTESKRITVDWTSQDNVQYDLFWSTDPSLDPASATSSQMEPDIQSPFVLDGLRNDQNYYFYLKAQRDDTTLTTDRLDTRLASPGVNGGYSGPKGGVTTQVQSNDGRVFIGGQFRFTGPSYGRLQVIDDRSGHQRAHPLELELVTAVTADGQGGYFYATDNPEQIKRVDADGQLDSDFLVNVSGDVLAMEADADTLYVGGEFSQVGGASRDYLAALSHTGDVLGWSPNPNDFVFDLEINNHVLYAAGEFADSNILGAGSRDYVATFDLSQNRTLMEWAPKPDHAVYALAAFDDRIVLGGAFSHINSKQRRGLAFVDMEGKLMSIDAGVDNAVKALSYHDEWLYVGGGFNTPQSHLFKLSLDGTVDTDWPVSLPDHAPEGLLATEHGLYVGGSINSGDQRFNNLFRYHPGGEVDGSIGYGLDRAVNDIALVGDRVVLATKSMIRVSGNKRGLAVLDLNGRWQDFPVTLDGPVQSLRIHQGDLYVGGGFEQVSAPNKSEPVTRGGVAAFALDSADLQSFSPQISYLSSPQGHEIHSILPMDGNYLISGQFDTVNGFSLGASTTERGGLTIVDSAGEIAVSDHDFADETNALLTDLALTDEYIYIGGTFSGFGGETAAEHIVRLHRTGADSGKIDSTWIPDITNDSFASTFGTVHDIEVVNNRVYMTGAFTEFNGTDQRKHLAAIEADGTLAAWTAELSGPSHTRGHDLHYLSNEDAFLTAGTFTTVDGYESGRLALINRDDGTLNSTAPLGNGLDQIKQSSVSYDVSRNPATGNICVGMRRHEQATRLWVGIYCMDHNGNLLW